MRFRERATIEAMQWFRHGDHDAVHRFRDPVVPGDTPCGYCAKTLDEHGWLDMIVCPGDWVVTTSTGKRYPFKPKVFEAAYEPAE